jgi:hypothetical protein
VLSLPRAAPYTIADKTFKKIRMKEVQAEEGLLQKEIEGRAGVVNRRYDIGRP